MKKLETLVLFNQHIGVIPTETCSVLPVQPKYCPTSFQIQR